MSKEKDGNWFKRHKILTIIISLVLVVMVIGVASGDSETKNTQSASVNGSPQAQKAKTEETAKIGTAVRDGKFEFIAKSIECGKASVGGQYLNKTAQGQYCLLTVNVKNIGSEAQSLFSSNQKLLNGSTEYSADDVATAYTAPDGGTWYNNINPGNSVEGVIVFDVPQGLTPTTAELHDSAYSGGVRIALQ